MRCLFATCLLACRRTTPAAAAAIGNRRIGAHSNTRRFALIARRVVGGFEDFFLEGAGGVEGEEEDLLESRGNKVGPLGGLLLPNMKLYRKHRDTILELGAWGF